MRAGVAYLSQNPPQAGRETSYYWYYATQVMYHLQGDGWARWNDHLRDMLVVLDRIFGTGDPYANQTNRALAEQFVEGTLNFPPEHFDGVLLWDTLQFLEPALLAAVMRRLHYVLRPASFLFALFHAEERAGAMTVYSYRIGDHHSILLQPRGERVPAQYFNNRDLERLFQEFASVKFFLTRDRLREVIVRR